MGNTLDVLCSASSPRPGHSAKVQEAVDRQNARVIEIRSFPQEVILVLGAEKKEEEVGAIDGIKLTIYHHPIKVPHEVMCRSFVTRGLALLWAYGNHSDRSLGERRGSLQSAFFLRQFIRVDCHPKRWRDAEFILDRSRPLLLSFAPTSKEQSTPPPIPISPSSLSILIHN